MWVKLKLYLIKLAREGIPKPKVGIAKIPIPNAYAFGRWQATGALIFLFLEEVRLCRS